MSLEFSLVWNTISISFLPILVTLWSSIVIYNLYFSPLSKIPSPLVYQLIPFYYHLKVAKGEFPFLASELHKKYGPIFRVSWNVVIIATPEGPSRIYGSYDFPKGRLYNCVKYFGDNLMSGRTKSVHSARKRLLAPAYTKNNVKLMEPLIKKVGLNPLIDNIEKHINLDKPVDLFNQFHYMTWDVIGELGFGQSFNMLQEGNHPAVHWHSATLDYAMLFYVLPFLSYFKVKTGDKLAEFTNTVLDKYYKKLDEGEVEHSLLSSLVNSEDKSTGDKLTRQQIYSETQLLLSAATETTSNSLTLLFYQIMHHPNVDAKLIKELEHLDLDNVTTDSCQDQLPYLNAVIKETMRLLPTVAGAPTRIVPDEGANFSGHFLPGGTEVGVPFYAIYRSQQIWPRAEEFIPERWLETDPSSELYVTPDMKKCFVPFFLGPNTCIGKHLAHSTMTLITTNLLKRYKFLPHKTEQAGEIELLSLPVTRPKQGNMTINVVRR